MRTRRQLLLAGIGGAVAAAGLMLYSTQGRNLIYSALTEHTQAVSLLATRAHAQAARGELLLIDIRRPDEWARTGVGEHAVALDMQRKDFMDQLRDLLAGDLSKPVALICARGVRSTRMSNQLARAGYTNVRNIPEGMLGSAAGVGWLKRGLPVVRDKKQTLP